MDVYDTIYSILVSNNNTISGRTVIQKLAYLSSRKIPELEVPPYMAHYYGPFSPGLGWALEKMVSYSFLYEANNPGDIYAGYTYGLTDDGRKIAKKAESEHKETFAKVSSIVKTCKDFCSLKTAPLSYATKIHYMLYSDVSRDNMSFSDAVQHARTLGWKVSKDNVEQGAQLLEKLELGTVS